MKILYTVRRIRKDDTLYGSIHGSKNGCDTVCGFSLNHNWYIINNTFDGEITCKKCLKILRDSPSQV